MVVRHARRYDQNGLPQRLQTLDMSQQAANDVSDLPEDHGMILVLDHVGLVTVPQPLEIRIVVGNERANFTLTEEERQEGVSISSKPMGAMVMWAKGPGSEIIDTWAALPLPGGLRRNRRTRRRRGAGAGRTGPCARHPGDSLSPGAGQRRRRPNMAQPWRPRGLLGPRRVCPRSFGRLSTRGRFAHPLTRGQ